MLKGIPAILSPQLLKVLCEMGHSDTLVIADGNFPLDSYISQPVSLMEVMSGDTVETPIWDTYEEIVKRCSGLEGSAIGHIERFAFYEEAKKAYAVIATGEKALYANILLQKGVV